jgi:hypothetical protein
MPLTPDTDLSLTLSAAALALGFVATAVWRAANFIRDLRDEIKGLRTDVRAAWTREEHERWAFSLERENTKLPLIVPSVPPRPVPES